MLYLASVHILCKQLSQNHKKRLLKIKTHIKTSKTFLFDCLSSSTSFKIDFKSHCVRHLKKNLSFCLLSIKWIPFNRDINKFYRFSSASNYWFYYILCEVQEEDITILYQTRHRTFTISEWTSLWSLRYDRCLFIIRIYSSYSGIPIAQKLGEYQDLQTFLKWLFWMLFYCAR